MPIATGAGAERRMYLALAAIVMLLVAGLARLSGWRFGAAVSVVCVLATAGTLLRSG